MNGDSFKRISQEVQRHKDIKGGILEGASAFAQRVLEEIEALAGTTACRSTLVACYQRDARRQSNW